MCSLIVSSSVSRGLLYPRERCHEKRKGKQSSALSEEMPRNTTGEGLARHSQVIEARCTKFLHATDGDSCVVEGLETYGAIIDEFSILLQ